MRSVIETLELYYQPLTQQKKHWDFFLALSDYVGFIVSEPDLLGILTEEYKKDLAEQARIAEYEKRSLKELEPKRNKLLAIVEKSGANSEGLKYAVSSIKNTPRLPQNAGYLEGSLFEIARHLAEEKGMEIVKEFIVSNDEYRKYTGAHSNTYGNFVFSKIFSSKIDYQRRYEVRRKIEIWQSIEALFTAHKAITVMDQLTKNFEEEYAKRAKADPTYKFVKDHTVYFAYGDVRKLRDYTGFQPEIDGMNYLELEEFRTYTRRVHLFLINQYRKRPDKVNIGEVKFDEYKSVLLIGTKPIKLTKFSNQYHFLKIIFQEPEKDWQYSEISELMDDLNKRPWKQLYNVADAIKKKVATETGIKDFLITNTQSAQINKKYLS